MPAKRRIEKKRARLTPELRPLAARYLELSEAHVAAIETGDESFNHDGRQLELVQIGWQVRSALGIKPWTLEPEEIIRAALEG